MTYAARLKVFSGAFKETLTSHFAGVGGLLAGFIVAQQLNLFQQFPWAIAIYPTVLMAKSVMSGLFSGRLNTALHIGTVRPCFRGNTRAFHVLFEAMIATTLLVSLATAVISVTFGSLFWGVALSDLSGILAIVLATMSFGLASCVFTLAIAFTAFKKGLDLDDVAYPIIATVVDVFITACYALTIVLFFNTGNFGRYCAFLVGVVPIVLMFYVLFRNAHEEAFVRAVRKSILTMLIVVVFANVAGTVLLKMNVTESRSAGLLIVYPALLELVNDAGLVVGSTAATKFALGLLKPSLSAIENHATPILGAWVASFVVFIFFVAVSLLMAGQFASVAFINMLSLLLATNVIATMAVVFLSFAFATLTFQKGLDPDHFVAPIQTALASIITSVVLFAVLLLIG